LSSQVRTPLIEVSASHESEHFSSKQSLVDVKKQQVLEIPETFTERSGCVVLSDGEVVHGTQQNSQRDIKCASPTNPMEAEELDRTQKSELGLSMSGVVSEPKKFMPKTW